MLYGIVLDFRPTAGEDEAASCILYEMVSAWQLPSTQAFMSTFRTVVRFDVRCPNLQLATTTPPCDTALECRSYLCNKINA